MQCHSNVINTSSLESACGNLRSNTHKIVESWKKTHTKFDILFLHLSFYGKWMKKNQNKETASRCYANCHRPRWQVTQLWQMSQVIDIPSKWRDGARVSRTWQINVPCVPSSSHLFLLSLRWRRWRESESKINTLCFHVWFHSFTSPSKWFFFWSSSRLCFITAILYPSQPWLRFAFSHSASITFLFALSPLPSLSFACSLSWHFFQAKVWGQLLLSDLSCFKCLHDNKGR